MKLIDKDALVAEIERRLGELSQLEKASYEIGLYDAYKIVLSFLDTLEVKEVDVEQLNKLLNWWKEVTTEHSVYKAKEVDLDALCVLAEHLIACDAHSVTPKYSDKEIDMLEKLKELKAQKGE